MNELMLATIGWTEMLLIMGIVLLLFGGSKIPQLMRGLGQGIHEFKKGARGEELDNQNPAPEVRPGTEISSETSVTNAPSKEKKERASLN